MWGNSWTLAHCSVSFLETIDTSVGKFVANYIGNSMYGPDDIDHMYVQDENRCWVFIWLPFTNPNP